MAYQEITTAANPADVINGIAVFAGANGWTVERNNLSGSNRTVTLKRAESDYVHLWNTNTSELRVIGSVDYAAGSTPDTQTNRGFEANANLGAGPYTKVFLFADSAPAPHIHIVVEVSAGIFRTISLGVLEKTGAYTGGTYYDATRWTVDVNGVSWNSVQHACFEYNRGSVGFSGSIRVDIPADSRTNAWANTTGYPFYNGLAYAISDQPSGLGALTTLAYNRNQAPFSGNVLLAPIQNYVLRVGGLYSPIGTFPNVRYLRMDRFSPGEEITIGTDTWKIFPFVRQGVSVASATPYSAQHAYAFKKVV
jgi:hypothetical protein